VTDALGCYYGNQADSGHGRYAARCGMGAGEVSTRILTHSEWLDLECPLTLGSDTLKLADAADSAVVLDEAAPGAAVQRLAETLSMGTRFVDLPLYRLTDIEAVKGSIGGSLAIAPFASYAMTLDLLEGELADALAAGLPAEPARCHCVTATCLTRQREPPRVPWRL
jgi:hypothetical protein